MIIKTMSKKNKFYKSICYIYFLLVKQTHNNNNNNNIMIIPNICPIKYYFYTNFRIKNNTRIWCDYNLQLFLTLRG